MPTLDLKEASGATVFELKSSPRRRGTTQPQRTSSGCLVMPLYRIISRARQLLGWGYVGTIFAGIPEIVMALYSIIKKADRQCA